MCHIPAKFVPNVLRGKQKEIHISMYWDFKERRERAPQLLLKIITGDEREFMGMTQKSQFKNN
jgi:hypothetical protein